MITLAYVMSMRSAGAGAPVPQEILSTTQTEVLTDPFSAGETITLTTVGSGILTGTLQVNCNEKLLVRGEDYDYIFTAPDEIELTFGDDPGNYANGELIIQISYAYNA